MPDFREQPANSWDELIARYQAPQAPSPGSWDELIAQQGNQSRKGALPPGFVLDDRQPLDGPPPISPENPFADLIAKARADRISADNPFADLIAKYGAGQPTVPSSGVTIAPKGGVPREASPQEARAINPASTWADVAGQAGENVIPSAKQFGSDVMQAVIHPVETGKTALKVGMGTAEKLVPGEQSHEKYANAVGRFLADRYGDMDSFKKTLAEDPVGVAADLATVLTGGELALARAPGALGKIGRIAGTASRAVDPINASLKAAGAVGKGIGNVAAGTLGVTTGAGGQAIRTAAKAGLEGGEAGQAFRDSMRGNVAMDDVVSDAKAAVTNLRQQRSQAYRAGMSKIAPDTTVLDFGPVDTALQAVAGVKRYKGISISDSTASIGRQILDKVNQWKQLDPAEYHTAEGFDALKQSLGDIRDSTTYGTPERRVADAAYNAVKSQIVKQAPQYAKVMANYQKASDLIREMEKTLSLNPKASVDTQLRKLQSVMRNNANTNYGKRADLAQILKDNGASNLMQKLAGQALSSAEPRGLARAVAALGGVAGIGGGAASLAGLVNPAVLLPIAAQLAMQSPRLVGEAAHFGGRAANALTRVPVRNALLTGYQTRGAGQ